MDKAIEVRGKGKNALQALAERLKVTPEQLQMTLKATAFKECAKNDSEFLAAVIVANTYGLNPLLKEIYAFPSSKGIIPIVPIDGWVSLVKRNKMYNGVELIENKDEKGNFDSVTAKFYLKDTEHPVVVTEYLAECKRATDTWSKWPRRMLRHKAYIQGARIAFGFAGIYDEDEAERISESVETVLDNVKPEVEVPRPVAQENTAPAPDTTKEGNKDTEDVELTDIMTVIDTPVNTVIPEVVSPYISVSDRKVTRKDGTKKTVCDYTVGDVGGAQVKITLWESGAILPAGTILRFSKVKVSEFQGEHKYSAESFEVLR